jgi:integrase
MKILAMTGIRISELRYFKVENMETYYIKVHNKGKERTIIVRQDLMRELKRYAREQGIKEGYLFPSPVCKGQMINVSTVWRHMKKLAGASKVKKSKVHAHSFRHLFAQVFLNTYTDSITELADILGHKSLETTRLYTRTSDAQKRTKLEQMDFV